MRKFRFRLQAVETLKKTREDEALRALAGAQRALQAEKERKWKLQQDLQSSLERREVLTREVVAPSLLWVEENFILGTKQRIAQIDQAIHRASRQVEKLMAVYLNSRKERRMIDKLREKAFDEFRDAELTRELKQLDDLYVMRGRVRRTA